jgi:hypothetical protein
MALDGSWGTATDFYSDRAIADAIANCKRMSGLPLGCGARWTIVNAGWSLGIRCGRTTIIVAEPTLADARKAALRQEVELRRHYQPNMPPCISVVIVDPRGVAWDRLPTAVQDRQQPVETAQGGR